MSRREVFYLKLAKDVEWTFWSIVLVAALLWLEAFLRLVFDAPERPTAIELWGPPAFMLAAYCLKSTIGLVIKWNRWLDNERR